jgi:DedD protein
MEQKKLLLIAISVGLFFVIIVGTALVFLKPEGALSSSGHPGISGPAPELRTYYPAGNPIEIEVLPEANTETEFSNGNILLSSSGQEEARVPENTASYPDALPQTLVSVDPKSTAGVPNVPVTAKAVPQPQPAAPVPVPTPAPAPAVTKAPAQAATSAKTSAGKSAPAQTTKTAQTKAPPKKTRDDYWVQTGAFTALSRAENIRQTLAEKGIASIIENRNVGDTLFFRVRIGPYTSQNEADYWLNLIKSINGFENSQVWKTQTTL